MEAKRINFTTPEQSKKLLELGLPAESADCYYYDWATNPDDEMYGACIQWIDTTLGDDYQKFHVLEIAALPCWSVGRLLEIYVLARSLDTAYLPIEKDEDMVKYIVRLYEEKIKDLDFSKLND